MDRRELIKTGLSSAAIFGVIAIGDKSLAQSEGTKLSINSDIGRNHGHISSLTYEDLIDFLVEEDCQAGLMINIQGDSGHNHEVELQREDIGSLLNQNILEIQSSTDASHVHTITMQLLVDSQ